MTEREEVEKLEKKERLYCRFCKPNALKGRVRFGIEGRKLVKKEVVWDVTSADYGKCDHIELGGRKASAIITYGADRKGNLTLRRYVAYPMLRVEPDLTRGNFAALFKKSSNNYAGGVEIKAEKLDKVVIKGTLKLYTSYGENIKLCRTFVASSAYPVLLERVEITNVGKDKIDVAGENKRRLKRTAVGGFEYCCRLAGENGDFRSGEPTSEAEKSLVANAKLTYYNVYFAVKKGEKLNFNAVKDFAKAEKDVNSRFDDYQLNCGDDFINAMFPHAACRGLGGIQDSANGLLHSPGGGNYYGAIWANDQMEYALPVFAMLGDDDAVTAGKNCIKKYEKFAASINGEGLPGSIVGTKERPIYPAGDRGDCAMIGAGTARFLLALGDVNYAAEKAYIVDWCEKYCKLKLTADGVVASDSDELEGRFPSGKCNLSTNTLYYELLGYGAILFEELGNTEKAALYREQRATLEDNIRKYFGGVIEGVDGYRYYEGNDILRSWSLLPYTVGIKGKEDAVEQVFKKLYSDGAMKTASDSPVVWDRSLLFALRGCFIAGKAEFGYKMLSDYCKIRLTGTHVPYPYEAFPEGNGAHLSAESLLLVRIISEGVAGIKPQGFGKLSVNPSLPKGVSLSLKGLSYNGKSISVEVDGGSVTVRAGSRVVTERNGIYEIK